MTLLILLLIIVGVALITWFLAKRRDHPVIRPGAPSHDGAKEPLAPMATPPSPMPMVRPVPPAPKPPLPPIPPSPPPHAPRPPFTSPL